MVKALPYLHDEPQSFPSASTPYASPEQVVFRDGQLQVDNGNCHTPRDVLFFTGQAPTHKADCLPNEVEVPDLEEIPAVGDDDSAPVPARARKPEAKPSGTGV